MKNPQNALAPNSRICAATLGISADYGLKAPGKATKGEGRLLAGSPSNFRRSLCAATGIVIDRKIRVFQQSVDSGRSFKRLKCAIAVIGRRSTERIEPIPSPPFEYWLGGGLLWLAAFCAKPHATRSVRHERDPENLQRSWSRMSSDTAGPPALRRSVPSHA